MPLDNLISIGGTSGGGGLKRGTASDLTSGLISISGARDNVDVDMSDFDVGDLLGDASSKNKSKSKDKSDDKKKKKSRDKEKSKSSSSKKKSKSKSKKSAFEDDFDNDDGGDAAGDWTSSAKNWDSAAELEMAAAVAARRKNGSGKLGGGLDDEFSKMLGLDSGDLGSGANFGSVEFSPPSPELVSLNRDNDRNNTFDTDDTFGISSYTPTVRGSKKLDRDEATTDFGAGESGKGGNEGLSAAFFQDDVKSDLDSTPLSSLLGPSTERRGGLRGGRRQTRGADSDPFGIGSTTTKSSSTFDALFGGPSDRRSTQNDPLADLFATPSASKKTTRQSPREEENEPIPKPAVVEARASTPPKAKTSPKAKTPPQKRADSPNASAPLSGISNVDIASAKDSLLMDLLGDLSPPKPREPLLSRRRSRSSNDNSPEKQQTQAEDPFKSSLPPSPVQSQPLPTVLELPVETPAVSANGNARPVTPPSPGRRRSLTVDKGALGIRESDFEQSKDSLLEEILPSSPLSISARRSPHRRHSYSQSFEVEDSVAAVAAPEQTPIEEKEPQILEKQPSPDPPAPTAPVAKSYPPPQVDIEPIKESPKLDPPHARLSKENHEAKVVLVPPCNCVELQAELTAAFDIERAVLQQKNNELAQQLEAQIASSNQLTQQLEALEASSSQLTQQLTKQLEENYSSAKQISQQLEERAAANTQLSQQLATAEHDKLQADQLAATSKNDAAGYQHRAEWLEAELRGLREELSRSKRAVQDAELALARKTAEQDEVDQLERHREKRALEALSAQMQRALARLTVTHQVQEEGSGYDNSAARVAAEDEARLRVIASLEGSSKRAAQHAEQERTKLTELLRELEAGARSARQGALEDKERLRQEQQRLDALSAHLQAQSAVLRDQEAGHAAYMGQQLAEAREDARVYEARLATRRTQLERDERALYEARAEFAAFREQTALEIEREHEELRASRLALEDAWRELRADREDLEAELASHEGEFQALESVRNEVQEAEARLAERTQEVVALAEKLDAGTRDLLAREQIVAEQAAVVQDTDSSMVNRERTLERVKGELEAREQRLHVQIRQLDNARGRLTQQRREQQQLTAVTRRHYSTTEKPAVVEVDNNKHWRHSELASVGHHSSNNNNFHHPTPVVDKIKSQPWEVDLPIEEDPSGLPPALRKQVEANWQRRNQQVGQRRQGPGLPFDLRDFDSTMAAAPKWSTKTMDLETPSHISKKSNVSTSSKPQSSYLFQPPPQQRPKLSPGATSFRASSVGGSQLPPPPSTRSPGTFQPKLRVNL
ncbi:hypothetical protein PRIC1_003154 [Phytophthora ramorum]